MILMEFLFAPTVPSEPSPRNTAWCIPGDSRLNSSLTSRDECVTSSSIPTVKCLMGEGFPASSKTAATMAGVNSLLPRPYLPPITLTEERPVSASALTTSRYSGSPADPGSLVRSRTATVDADSGSAFAKASELNGL
ncbi:MAG: hypothetical protein BWX47_01918 [candidate division Hyd24-12 bacterium ADurb.Bin004]|nr:MAG: hypothetical protein BWX47_01918 [candidate division Hyd24-12 bacterium ADurb.Bin004]